MQVSNAIPEFLVAENVNTIFSLMSEELLGVMSALHRDWGEQIDVIQTRHEQAAVAMADGYSRTSGKIGVAVVGRGPAIAQTATALVTAEKKGSKVLVIIPEMPRPAIYDRLNKDFRQQTFLESLVDNVINIRNEQRLVPKFADAFRILKSDNGPVAVQIPWDILDGETEHVDTWQESTIGSNQPDPPNGRIGPDPEDIKDTVELYLESDASQPPIILGGQGAVRSNAKPAIENLAERMSAILATTLQANGYFSDHPFSVGLVGDLGTTFANEYLVQSKFVLAIGCSLNNHTTDYGHSLEDTNVVHIDINPEHIQQFYPVDLGIVGDARLATEAIDAELKRQGIDFSGRFWTDSVKRRIRNTSPFDQREFDAEANRIDPRDLIRTLDPILPDDRLVITDAGHFIAWILDGITIQHPDDFIWTLDFGSIGIGNPIGLGAAYASRDRTPIIFSGDGGIQMYLQELNTAVQEEIDVFIVVINDNAWGVEYHKLEKRNLESDAAVIEGPNFASLADEFGAEGYEIRSIEDIKAISDKLNRKPDGPILLDCKVNRNVRHRFMEAY